MAIDRFQYENIEKNSFEFCVRNFQLLSVYPKTFDSNWNLSDLLKAHKLFLFSSLFTFSPRTESALIEKPKKKKNHNNKFKYSAVHRKHSTFQLLKIEHTHNTYS